MSITTPANPADAVRLVVDRGRTVGRHRHRRPAQGRPLRLEPRHLGDPQPLQARRAAADAPPHRFGRRLHIGRSLALPRVRLLHLSRLLPLRAGQLGTHPARARGQHGGHRCLLHHRGRVVEPGRGRLRGIGLRRARHARGRTTRCSKPRATRAPMASSSEPGP